MPPRLRVTRVPTRARWQRPAAAPRVQRSWKERSHEQRIDDEAREQDRRPRLGRPSSGERHGALQPQRRRRADPGHAACRPARARRSTCCTRAIQPIPRCANISRWARRRWKCWPWPYGDEIAPALSARLKGYDLVLTGTRAEGTEDSGMLPYQLADALGFALLASAVDIEVEARSTSRSGNSCRKVCAAACRQACPRWSPCIPWPTPRRATRTQSCAKARSNRCCVSAANASDKPRLVDQARDGKTRAAGGRRKAFGPRAHALGHDHGKPRRQRRN